MATRAMSSVVSAQLYANCLLAMAHRRGIGRPHSKADATGRAPWLADRLQTLPP